MELLVIGIVVALNIIVILIKFKKQRIEDGIFDSALLVLVTVVFGGSYAGLVVATVASMLISIYLWSSPPKFFSGSKNKKGMLKYVIDELKEF